MSLFGNQADLDDAIERLICIDARFGAVWQGRESVALRQMPCGLAGLLKIVMGQQVSVASARAIWERFIAAYPDCDAGQLAVQTEEQLQACGLSRPKIKTVQRVSQAVVDGFDLGALSHMEAEQAHKELVRLHGIGPWTADIYLLFGLGVADIFPSGDLALQVAAQHLVELDERPSAKQVAKLAAELWAPERGAAAHLLWDLYRQMKEGRDGVI